MILQIGAVKIKLESIVLAAEKHFFLVFCIVNHRLNCFDMPETSNSPQNADAQSPDVQNADAQSPDAQNAVQIFHCRERDLDIEAVIEQWGDVVKESLSLSEAKIFIVDFQDVYIITSSVLTILLSLNASAVKRGILFGLCGFNEYIKSILSLTNLDQFFIIGNQAEDTINLLTGKLKLKKSCEPMSGPAEDLATFNF